MGRRGARFTLGLLAACLLSGCAVDFQHDLSEQDANEIYVLLEQNGISPKKDVDEGNAGQERRYKIMVPRNDISSAARLLREYSLPRTRFGGLEAIRKGKGMIPTQVEERAIFLEGIAGEISNSLNLVDGVLDARVVVNIPPRSDLAAEKKAMPSASVFVKYRLNPDGKPPLDEPRIQKFVASAVEDLIPSQVTVIMTPAVLPDAMTIPADQQPVDVLGIRTTRATAGQLKTLLAVGGIIILFLVAFSTWMFMRSTGTTVRPRRRTPEGGA